MKKINFEKLRERNDYTIDKFLGGIQMEFTKIGKNYLIKDSNGRIVSEKEKLLLENKEMILKDIKSNDCQQETTKKIKKNKKRVKEIEKTETKEESVDELIEETDKTI